MKFWYEHGKERELIQSQKGADFKMEITRGDIIGMEIKNTRYSSALIELEE